ncbi:MAG: hypothetical protein WD490_08325 [Opitutales bacterium]
MKSSLPSISTLSGESLRKHGVHRARSASEIARSPWAIGLETIDRYYVDFAPLMPHLGALGATEARVQAGWARCEPVPDGGYDWKWLDEIVDGCLSQGVTPWLQTSYGNPAYEGGGGIGLSQGLPTSEAAKAGWDRWVAALVDRYADRVHTWEIWNEADHKGQATVEEYLDLYLRSARIIRGAQPDARLLALSLAGNLHFAEGFLRSMAERGETGLIDEITFHGYPHNPDENFYLPHDLAELCDRYAPHVLLRQGETGSPSRTMEGISLALNHEEWSERKQAVWDLRRLLCHHARGYRMCLFQMADMWYAKRDGALYEGVNPKGLLEINPDKSVSHRKPSYVAAQQIFSLLDGSYPLRELSRLPLPSRVTGFAWQRQDRDHPNLVIWWKGDAAPRLTPSELKWEKLSLPPLRDPLLLDLLDGSLYEPRDDGYLPLSDSPIALVERDSIEVTR